ncbi:uncharacterized protein LOC110857256 [Folsomia candida]|uniref:BET1-like protein n=1 Tax=Folsomia candida TaxID=158441 RepID=A0A226F8H4_FOLCA|nr:uncharacterized protein LOC110857256 [Folsomia candida]OXA65156.1 BET1-like protein [Folsomia candida]
MYGNSRTYRGPSGSKTVVNMDEDMMESANSTLAEGLSSKVNQLKNLAFDLDSEARDQIPLLDGLGDEMESGRARLGGSSGRLRNIGLTRGVTGNKMTCYVGLAIVTLLIFFYYVIIPRVLN